MTDTAIRLLPEPPESQRPRTTRLCLEPLGPAHQEEVAALHQDTATMEWLAGPRTAEETATILAAQAAHWERHGFGLWALRLRGDGRFVGRGGLRHTVVGGRPEVELAYALHSSYHGLGLASELAEASLAVGFERLGLPRITCFTQPHNLPSRRVMERAGFVYERDVVHADLPHVLYALDPGQRGVPGYAIRLAEGDDLPALAAVERAAGRLFEGTVAPQSVLGDVTDEADLREAQAEGLLWVAIGPGARPVGFAMAEELEESLHLDELSVHPAHGRRGLGAALVGRVVTAARARGLAGVTLTTFRELPFNAPYYERLGFQELPAAGRAPELAAIVAREEAKGLPARDRVVMRCATAAPHGLG